MGCDFNRIRKQPKYHIHNKNEMRRALLQKKLKGFRENIKCIHYIARPFSTISKEVYTQ
jgi:hypothetical protein